LDATNAGAFSKFQYRLASNYFPYQPVENLEEAFQISKTAFERADPHLKLNNPLTYKTSNFIVAVPLKSEHSISSSGLAVNNSANVALEYEGNAQNKIYYTFLVYTSLARVFLSQVSVKI
jgi:hypothetical protein